MSILNSFSARKPAILAAATLCCALAFGGVAVAQQPGAQQMDPQTMQQMQQAQQRMQEIHQELAQIQQDTLENEPELVERIEALEDHAIERMSEAGHDPEASVARLEELSQELQTTDDPQRQQELAAQFQEEQMNLQQAQQVLMQDESFMARQQELQDDLLESMRERHPETDELLAEIDTMQQEMMQQHQQGAQLQ